MRERRMTIARTAAAASPPSGVRVSWWGRLSHPQALRSAGAPACVGRALTSRMTRPSSAGSIWTGRRRCRAMRSITSSIGSNTLGLFQHRLELLARPLDAHLQRGDTRAGEPRHVLVLELLDMLEEERLTRVGRETRQRPSDRVVPLGPPVRSRQRRGLECRRIVDEPAGPARGGRAGRAAPVHQNAVQPRTEALGIVAACERAIGADEGVLQHLFRVFPISEQVQRVPAQAIAIPRDEIGVSTGVAGLHAAHQGGVARPHVTYTHARPPGVTSLSRSGSCDAALHRRGIYHKGDLQARCQRSWSMSRRATLAGCLAVALSLAGGYQDDTTVTAPPRLRPRITVRLTDAPFPYDSLHGVTIYVVRLQASTAQDSSGGDPWAVITEPRKSFDLLALQQGTTALLGEGEMPAGRYHRVRMTIDTSLSSITWNDAAQTPAHVNC